MSVETHLKTEIETEFASLSAMTPGSDEHKATLDSVTKLMDRLIEIEKIEVDCDDRAAIRENEQRLKEQQMDDEKKDRLVKNILNAAGILLPLIVTIWGTRVSLKFEEEGTITTAMGRGFIQRLLPKK